MTTLLPPPPPWTLPPEYSALTDRLDAAGNAFRLATLLRAVATFFGILAPLTTALLFAAGYFTLPAALLIAMVGLWLAAVVYAYVKLLHGPIFHRPTYAQIARLVELHSPGQGNGDLHNLLTNAILLAEESRHHPWTSDLVKEAHHHTAHVPLQKSVPWRRPRNAWLVTLALVMVCGVAIWSSPNTFLHGIAVIANPTRFVPRQGSIKIVSVTPGNDTSLAGQSLLFSATLDSLDHKPVSTFLTIHYASGKTQTLPMSPFGADNSTYTRQGITAAEDLDYFITAGDTQSERFHITVLPEIHLANFELATTPPAYTGLPSATIKSQNAKSKTQFEAPLGSQIALSISLDAPAREVLLDSPTAQQTPPIPLARSADGRSFTLAFPLKENARFTLRVNDGNNRTLRIFPDTGGQDFYSITATPDAPPTVAAADPGRDTDAKPGDKVQLAAQSTDDYGIIAIRLEIAKNNAKEFTPLQTWPIGTDKQNKSTRFASVKYTLDLPAANYKLGDTLRYRFIAIDNRDLTSLDPALAAQSTQGQIFTINFNDTAAATAKSSKLWDELREKLTDLLNRQIALRKQVNDLVPTLVIADLRKLTNPIADSQKSLRSDIASLAKDFPFEPSMKLVQKSLQVLAVEDASAAVDRTADILLLAETRTLAPIAMRLRQNQNRIIDVLQTLLAIIGSDQDRLARKVENKDGGDLPSDARDAWRKLVDDLKDFQQQQRTVIDATADLAKKPKDQFGPEDDKRLSELAAIEEKWEKFLSNRLADLSKIAEQDLANGSLLEELVKMKVELATAKNALETKATEIATALEDNALESAKELTTHLERWLQNKPDRLNWQMEEPVTQNDQHMAELPTQLQDMVGDLMDKEEDLTEEMESLASKWADSLDKGAGWDAMDGPISNMTAQGVTGNQLPKDMEIQGRSGEGREGRSSGEMVGSTAEGKEGRRTPTRLTNDAFSTSQVDDKSTLPTGGATGGGKIGGAGHEGLEGPAPDKSNSPEHLSRQQAQIRNEAERLALQMHAAGFDNFKLLESNAYLKKSEDALKANRYQSALYYQQQAVQSLNTAKVIANGQVHVVADTSPAADTKTQKNIDAALNGPLPKGYADPVKAYFEKLAAPEK